MTRYCARCGGRHEIGQACPRRGKRVGTSDAEIAAFRRSNAWKSKSEDIRDRDGNLCRWCLRNRMICRENLSVHHILALKTAWERRLDDDNLVTLCGECHKLADVGAISESDLLILAREAPRAV